MTSGWFTPPEDDKLKNSIYSLKDSKAYGISFANANSSQWKLTETSERLLNEIDKDKGGGTDLTERFKIPSTTSASEGSVASEGTKVSEGTKAFDGTKAGTVAGLGAISSITGGLAALKPQREETPGSSPHLNVKKPKFDYYIPEEWLA